MSVSIADFWNLTSESRLLTPNQLQRLQAEFQGLRGAGQSNAAMMVEWLVAQNAVSRFQARILLAGRAGPFFFGDYRLYDRLASGPLQGCFRAVHSPSGHPVLLQFLTGAVTKDSHLWAELVERVMSQSEWEPRQLFRCYEPVDLGTHKFIVYEDVQGRTADQRLAAGALPVADACLLARQVALALAPIHRARRAHGDVRPRNIWLLSGGAARLWLDATSAKGTTRLSETPERADYLAPEFAQPGKAPDALTDIYALGCTLYHLLTGGPPFAGGDLTRKMHRHANEAVQPQGAPPPLAELLLNLMAKNPAVRLPNVESAAETLSAFVDSQPLVAGSVASPPTEAPFLDFIRRKQESLARDAATVVTSAAPRLHVNDGDGEAGADSLTSRVKSSRSSRSQRTSTLLFGSIGVAVAAMLLLALFLGNRGTDTKGPGQKKGPSGRQAAAGPDEASTGGAGTASTTTGQGASAGGVSAGDSDLLWASPTGGSAVQLDNVPPDGQVFLVLRPADLLTAPQGAKVLLALETALGPKAGASREQWEKAAGVAFADIEQLLVSLHANGGRFPRACFRVRLREGVAMKDVQPRWGSTSPIQVEGREVLQTPEYAFYLPSDDKRTFVMGPLEEIRELASVGGAPQPLRREVKRLLEQTDADRHFTALFAANFFFTDGRELFSGDRRRGLEPLEWFLGDNLQGGSFSAHFGELFFAELRLMGRADLDEFTLAKQVRQRIAEIHPRIESYVVNRLNPPEYWRLVAYRVPGMIAALNENTRAGAEDDQAIVNLMLPGAAAHNLAFGGAMVLITPPGAAATTAAAKQTPGSLAELLQSKASLTFDQTSLEFAMRDVAADVVDTYGELPFPFEIKIIGNDLEKDGITRNQQIVGFEQGDKPLAEILTALVMKANPVTTVKSPSELDQKLIWVVAADPADAKREIVLITTRKAAQANNYTLPPPFQPK